jgi:hypothetical protein
MGRLTALATVSAVPQHATELGGVTCAALQPDLQLVQLRTTAAVPPAA